MRVKFCGITRFEDAQEAARLGAWAIGLNHWAQSPRRCDPAVAAEIGATLRRRLEVVGVFVNSSLDEIDAAAEDESLTMLQLHGDEGPAYCAEAARRSGLKVMKAVRAKDAHAVRSLAAYPTDFHMIDAYVPGTYGGTGERFDWELAAAHTGGVPLVLSGGLTPETVGEALATVRPYAVDVASGVEAAPGVKDPERMRSFFEAARSAAAAAQT
jgi:phosphoribosylanthranilate isomerase